MRWQWYAFAMKAWVVLFLVSSTGFFLARCSLNTFRPALRIHLANSDSLNGLPSRPPELSNFSFAVIATGNVAPTVDSATVKGRNVQCLYLDGQVTYPVSYKQLTESGFSINLPTGTFRFTIVGFDTPPSGQTTLAALFNQATIPAEYFVARGTADTASGKVSLTSEFDSNSGDRLQACPAPAPGDFTLKSAYLGFSGVSGSSSLSFTFGEAGIPPVNVTGSTMSEISSLIGAHELNSTGLGINHMRLDGIFTPPANLNAYNSLKVEAYGKSGITPEDGEGLCTYLSNLGPAFQIRAFKRTGFSWIVGIPNSLSGGQGYSVSSSGGGSLSDFLQADGNLLVSFRTSGFGNGTQCGTFNLNSIIVRAE